MKEEVNFSENVILIDTLFLSEVAGGMRNFLSERLSRSLPDLDLPMWLTYIALDAGIKGDNNEIQVLLVCNDASRKLNGCLPSELSALDGMACRTSLGEFSFSVVPAENLVTGEQLYIDLLNLTLDAAGVKRLLLVPSHLQYGPKVEEVLRKFFADKSEAERQKATYFIMEPPAQPVHCVCNQVTYSLAFAWGMEPGDF